MVVVVPVSRPGERLGVRAWKSRRTGLRSLERFDIGLGEDLVPECGDWQVFGGFLSQEFRRTCCVGDRGSGSVYR